VLGGNKRVKGIRDSFRWKFCRLCNVHVEVFLEPPPHLLRGPFVIFAWWVSLRQFRARDKLQYLRPHFTLRLALEVVVIFLVDYCGYRFDEIMQYKNFFQIIGTWKPRKKADSAPP